LGRVLPLKLIVANVPEAVSHLTAALWFLVVGTWMFFYKNPSH